MSSDFSKRIAIIGREKQTLNYQRALDCLGINYEITLTVGKLSGFDALLLPGGGDIDPKLLNEPNHGSRNIDKELDLLQFQALDLFIKCKKPVLGICKGFQLINLYFGARLIQDLPSPSIHPVTESGNDAYHEVFTYPLPTQTALPVLPSCFFSDKTTINSAHHQGITENGKHLFPFQTASDGITEALIHEKLPIVAFQWHPERMLLSENPLFQKTGRLAFDLFFLFFKS